MVAKLSDRIEGLPYNGVKVGDPVSLLENDVPYAKESQLVTDNLLINGALTFGSVVLLLQMQQALQWIAGTPL